MNYLHTHLVNYGALFFLFPMDLASKLQSLKGAVLDEETIAQLIAASASVSRQNLRTHHTESHHHYMEDGQNSVDDLLVASRAAEMELDSMRRYFPTPSRKTGVGIDGLADEELSPDSEDEIVNEIHQVEKSALDKILAKNSMIAVVDGEEEDDEDADFLAGADLSNVPTSVVVPDGAKFVDLGKIQYQVDGLLVIGEVNVHEESFSVRCSGSVPTACDVESLVCLKDSEPLTVIGMVVDTLGSVKQPMHLVLVTNKELISRLSSENSLIGAQVCTIDSHSKLVEIDEIDGSTVIRGAPQLGDIDECDDDGADVDDQPAPLPIANQAHQQALRGDYRYIPRFGYGYQQFQPAQPARAPY